VRSKSEFLGIAAAIALSGASSSALAAPCPTQPSAVLGTYFSGGANATCTVLDKTISGMTLTNVSPSNFIEPSFFPSVQPILTANNPGLSFQSMGSAIGTGPNTFTITYTITAPSSDPITDASLALSGQTFPAGGGFPAGSFQVTEMLNGGTLGSLSASNLGLTDRIGPFAPTTSLTVTDSGTVTLGILDDLTNQFSETPTAVPEPSSLILLGLGLSALGLVPRRKKRS
jgi:hypothetical protein